MNTSPSNIDLLAVVTGQLAVIAIMAAGITLMLQRKSMAVRLLVLGVVLAAVSSVAIEKIP